MYIVGMAASRGRRWSSICSRFLLLLLLAMVSSRSKSNQNELAEAAVVQSLGINYGMMGDDLLSPPEVASLLRSIFVTQTRIYSADPEVLRAFAYTGISVIINIGNEEVAKLSGASSAAKQYAANWVQQSVAPFFPATQISGILVGNEVLTENDSSLSEGLLSAMQNIYAALRDQDLDGEIFVSTPHSVAVLANSYPPSAGAFSTKLLPYLRPLLQFLKRTGAPFMLNAYPYFAYKSDPSGVSLSYALSAAADDNGGGGDGGGGSSSSSQISGRLDASSSITDPVSGLTYTSMLFAQIDAAYAAIASAGFEPDSVPIVVSETGWPSSGDPDETGANADNAREYNFNLVARLRQDRGSGTPAHPHIPLSVFIFALFNEDQKPGPASERNYGLFYPNGSAVYDAGLKNGQYSTTFVSYESAAGAAAANLGWWLVAAAASAVFGGCI